MRVGRAISEAHHRLRQYIYIYIYFFLSFVVVRIFLLSAIFVALHQYPRPSTHYRTYADRQTDASASPVGIRLAHDRFCPTIGFVIKDWFRVVRSKNGLLTSLGVSSKVALLRSSIADRGLRSTILSIVGAGSPAPDASILAIRPALLFNADFKGFTSLCDRRYLWV